MAKFRFLFNSNPIDTQNEDLFIINTDIGNLWCEFISGINNERCTIGASLNETIQNFKNFLITFFNSYDGFVVASGSNYVDLYLSCDLNVTINNNISSLSIIVTDELPPFMLTVGIEYIDCYSVLVTCTSTIECTDFNYELNGVDYNNHLTEPQYTHQQILPKDIVERFFTVTAVGINNELNINGGTIPPQLQISQFEQSLVFYGGIHYLFILSPYVANFTYNFFENGLQIENFYPIFASINGNVIVSDQYGCSVELSVNISNINGLNNYVHIPKSNSIRFKHNQEFNSCLIQENDENTLSCETLNVIKHKEIQLFNLCDIIRTQFRSNANTISAICNGVELDIVKITNNIGSYVKLECVLTNEQNYSYIGFNSGNIYNSQGQLTGTHELNGALPDYVEVGGAVSINGVLVEVLDIIYNEETNYFTLKVEQQPILTQNLFSYFFNKENYEVYEFDINPADISSEASGFLRVYINNDNIQHISELIKIEKKHKNTLFIEYWNVYNTDILYNGWKHKLRMMFQNIKMSFSGESNSYKGDSNSVLYNNSNFDINTFVFEPITRELAYKLNLALSHKFVYINGVRYIKDGEIEVEKIGDDANLYVVTAKMLKADMITTIINNSLEQFENGLIENDINGLIINDN